MTTVVIDYGGGNLCSVQNALERLGVEYVVSPDPTVVARAERVIFPGQGAAAQALSALRARGLEDASRNLKVPYLGICIGMQLLYEKSEEGNTSTLGVLSGCLSRFFSQTLKIPQMGWNTVKFADRCPLFKGIFDNSYFYFVHSYTADLSPETIGVSFYGQPFTSVVRKNNFFGVQFHPEKSGEVGQQLLRNFLSL
jgi:glutamine amidotransferase